MRQSEWIGASETVEQADDWRSAGAFAAAILSRMTVVPDAEPVVEVACLGQVEPSPPAVTQGRTVSSIKPIRARQPAQLELMFETASLREAA